MPPARYFDFVSLDDGLVVELSGAVVEPCGEVVPLAPVPLLLEPVEGVEGVVVEPELLVSLGAPDEEDEPDMPPVELDDELPVEPDVEDGADVSVEVEDPIEPEELEGDVLDGEPVEPVELAPRPEAPALDTTSMRCTFSVSPLPAKLART